MRLIDLWNDLLFPKMADWCLTHKCGPSYTDGSWLEFDWSADQSSATLYYRDGVINAYAYGPGRDVFLTCLVNACYSVGLKIHTATFIVVPPAPSVDTVNQVTHGVGKSVWYKLVCPNADPRRLESRDRHRHVTYFASRPDFRRFRQDPETGKERCTLCGAVAVRV